MLKPRLLIIMQRELDSEGLQLTPYCVQQIEQLVIHGVGRLQLNKADNHPSHVINAEHNLKALIQYLGNYSRNEGTFPNLDNAGFDAAMRNSPPFWPYCS